MSNKQHKTINCSPEFFDEYFQEWQKNLNDSFIEGDEIRSLKYGTFRTSIVVDDIKHDGNYHYIVYHISVYVNDDDDQF